MSDPSTWCTMKKQIAESSLRMMRWAHVFIGAALIRLFQPLFTIGRVHGLAVYDFAEQKKREELLQRLDRAMQTISQYDQKSYSRIRKSLRAFSLSPSQGAMLIPFARTCVLSVDWVNTMSAEELSLIVIHEATHAHIERLGIRYGTNTRARIEDICFRAEDRFLRLRYAGDVVPPLRKVVRNDHWLASNRIESRMQRFDELQTPNWYRRLYRFLNEGD